MLDIPEILSALGPAIQLGRSIAGQYALEAVYWVDPDTLRFQIGDWRVAFGVDVGPRNDDPAFCRTSLFSLKHVALRGADPTLQDDAARWAAKRLAEAIASAESTLSPGPLVRSVPRSVPAVKRLNLLIPGECGSQCDFCDAEVLQVPAQEFTDAYHDQLLETLSRASVDQGASWVRFDGSEPLLYPRILELVVHAVSRGYTHVTVNTTGLPLDRRFFAGELISAMPPQFALNIPLYGSTAEQHERITKNPGSFLRVLGAIGNLLKLKVGPKHLGLSTVILPGNLHDIPAIRDMAFNLGLPFHAHMPYPGKRPHVFPQVSMRLTDVVHVLHGLHNPVPVLEAPPCILLRHEIQTEIPSFTSLMGQRVSLDWPPLLDSVAREGTAGWFNPECAVVECEGVSTCLLSGVCSRRIYQVYLQLHGDTEFSPVGARELVRAVRGRAAPIPLVKPKSIKPPG